MNAHHTLTSKLVDLRNDIETTMESIFLNNKSKTKKFWFDEKGEEVDVLTLIDNPVMERFGISRYNDEMYIVGRVLLGGYKGKQSVFLGPILTQDIHHLIKIVEKLENKYN